jgi:hypothetical protein
MEPAFNASWLQECDDELREEGSDGAQSLFRVVRIPFRVRSHCCILLAGAAMRDPKAVLFRWYLFARKCWERLNACTSGV